MNNLSYEKIKEDIYNMGIKKGDDILIHSSFKSLGYVEGGIKTLIEAFISCIGDRGTLLIPTLSHRSVHANEPYIYDVKTTPACVGAVTEFFRTYNGVKRSLHPTHSVSVYGFRQEEYINKHYLDNEPVGENSPFYFLPEFGGKVIMLGCKTGSNTSIHGVEEKAKVPYVLSPDLREYLITDEKGNTEKRYMHYHYISQNGYTQKYARLENLMEFQKGKILEADCHLIDAATMWKKGLEKIKEDPFYFVEKVEK